MNSHEPVRRVRLDANCSFDVGPDREPGLAHLVVGLTAIFVFTSLTLGAPPVPTSAPALRTAVDIEMLVRSPSTDQLGAGLVLLTWAIWLGWGLLVATTLLRVLAVVTESVTSEAAWARSFRTVSDVVTLPWVRRAVDASLAGTLFLRVSAATFAADEMAVAPAVVQTQSHDGFWRTVPEPPGHLRSVEPGQPAHAPELGTSDVLYTVEKGDSLGKIADRFYGTWAAYKRLYEANAGREQPDGRTLENERLIYPGWRLVIPAPTREVYIDGEGHRVYTVRQGDTLWAISARLLGDSDRFRELFAINEGAVVGDGRRLTNPGLIWPGLRLRLPDREDSGAPSTASESGKSDRSSGADTDRSSDMTPGADTSTPTADSTDPNRQTPASGEAYANSGDLAGSAALSPASAATPVARTTPEPVTLDSSSSIPLTATNAPANQPVQDATPEAAPTQTPPRLVSPMVGAGAGAGIAVASLAGAALVLRRRHPTSLRTHLETDVEATAGFAEVELADDLAREPGADNVNTASVIAARMSCAVAAVLFGGSGASGTELPTRGASLAAVRHGRSSTALVLQQVPMAARAQLIACLPDAATRAFGEGSDVEGMITRDGDVLIRMTGITDRVSPISYAVEGLEHDPEAWPAPSLLLRLGLLANGEVFAANWDALTHILVASPLGQGADAMLAALVASLVAARSPEELGLIVLASPHALPEELLRLPHLIERPIDPHDEQRVLGAITLARKGLEQRIASGRAESADLVLVMAELGQLSAEHIVALGPIMLHGPRYRVRVLAATARPAVELVQRRALVPEFGTRLVLRARDEEESVALLGSGDATNLGPGGYLLVRLEGRLSLEAKGYRVAADRLARLAAVIRDQPGSAPRIEPAATGRIGTAPDVGAADNAPEREPHAEPDVEETEDDEDESESFEQAVEPPDIAPGFSRDGVQAYVEGGDAAADLPLATPTVEPSNGSRSTAAADEAEGSTEEHGPHRAVASILTTRRPLLRVLCLGTRALVYGDTLLWPTTETVDEACWELLVYLAVNDPAGVQGEVLADALLSEGSVDRSGLRKRRRKLRQLLGDLVPSVEGEPLPRDPQGGVYRLDRRVIESDVHRFLLLLDAARTLPSADAVGAYEQALELYRGDLLDRTDVPFYRWFDEGARPARDLRVKYAEMHRAARRRLAELLAAGPHDQLGRAEELYRSLVEEDPLDKGLWEALVNLHGRQGDLLGLESTVRRLRGTLAELGEEGMPATLERSVGEVRARLTARVA